MGAAEAEGGVPDMFPLAQLPRGAGLCGALEGTGQRAADVIEFTYVFCASVNSCVTHGWGTIKPLVRSKGTCKACEASAPPTQGLRQGQPRGCVGRGTDHPAWQASTHSSASLRVSHIRRLKMKRAKATSKNCTVTKCLPSDVDSAPLV